VSLRTTNRIMYEYHENSSGPFTSAFASFFFLMNYLLVRILLLRIVAKSLSW
jgi:hypothetical protein